MYVQFLFQLKQKKENKMFTKVMSRKLITLEKKKLFLSPYNTKCGKSESDHMVFSKKGNYDILSSTGFLLLFLCMTSLFTCRIIGYLSDIYTQRLNISITVLLLLKQIPNKPLLLYSQYNSRTNMVVHCYLWSKLQSIITSL